MKQNCLQTTGSGYMFQGCMMGIQDSNDYQIVNDYKRME